MRFLTKFFYLLPRMKWFFIDESITDGERRQGPYSIDEIHEFVNQGKITDDTLVWHSGESDWKTWKEASQTLKEELPPLPPDDEETLRSTIEALEQIVKESKSRARRFPGFFVRAFAFIVDNVILGLFGGITLYIIACLGLVDLETVQQAASTYMNDPFSPESMNTLLGTPGMSTFISIWSVIQTVYFIAFHATLSATPGKKLVHIHVETVGGERLNWLSSTARYLCSLLTQFSLALYGLGYLIVCIDPKRRALHDWIARTYVVYDEPKGSKDSGNKSAGDKEIQ